MDIDDITFGGWALIPGAMISLWVTSYLVHISPGPWHEHWWYLAALMSTIIGFILGIFLFAFLLMLPLIILMWYLEKKGEKKK